MEDRAVSGTEQMISQVNPYFPGNHKPPQITVNLSSRGSLGKKKNCISGLTFWLAGDLELYLI